MKESIIPLYIQARFIFEVACDALTFVKFVFPHARLHHVTAAC